MKFTAPTFRNRTSAAAFRCPPAPLWHSANTLLLVGVADCLALPPSSRQPSTGGGKQATAFGLPLATSPPPHTPARGGLFKEPVIGAAMCNCRGKV